VSNDETATPQERAEILIVDDVPDNIRVLNAVLRKHYKLKAVPSGERALSLVHQGLRPDLILLDIMMPGMDGYEVCRRLKADPDMAEIPVIFVTAKNAETDEAEGLALGAVDYIAKPIRPAILLARVQTHLKLRALQVRLERLSVTDELTGSFNRRYFIRQGEIEFNRHRRHGRSLVLLMLDIDHFKRVNDLCGHAVGDRVLKQLSETIRAQLRESDLFARIGGEEFVVMLPETSEEEALGIAERLRSGLHLDFPEYPNTLSVSIGIASLNKGDDSMECLLHRADKGLYRAKKGGRDRVEFVEPGDATADA